MRKLVQTSALFYLLAFHSAYAQVMSPRLYDMGSPVFTEIWVDPLNGDDTRDGSSRAQALRGLDEAWNRIPQGQTLTTGVHVRIMPGTLTEDHLPVYMESRYGSFNAPILIEAADGPRTVFVRNSLNIFDCHYLYLKDLDVGHEQGSGDELHFEACDHIYVKNCVIIADRNAAQETVKVNQTQYIYIEDCDIHGAQDNALDFVAVQYGHVVGNKIHDAEDWCMYVKGGSAYLRIEGNQFYNGGTGGFSAGQGTGFEFTTSPWIHYEAYHIVVINNIIYDCEGAALGVQGGYNILIAHNTAFRIGARSHIFEAVAGYHSCDGDPNQCTARNNSGGWGPTAPGPEIPIPNRNVYVYNNIFYNPAGSQSQWQHFTVFEPQSAPAGSNLPDPIQFDTNLRLAGNMVWNGPADHPLGVEDSGACTDANPTCNVAQLRADNAINTVEPQFINAAGLDFGPQIDGNILNYSAQTWPAFSGGDLPTTPTAPQGLLSVPVTRDFYGNTRGSQLVVGAIDARSMCNDCTPTFTHVRYLPHYTFVNSAWTTELSLVNPTDAEQSVRLTAYSNSGEIVGTWDHSLPAQGGWSAAVETYTPTPTAQAGWIRIETTDADVNGLMKFTFLETGGSSSLPLTQVGGRRLLLPLLETKSSLVSGLALVNLSQNVAQVTLRLSDLESSSQFSTIRSLNPDQKIVNVLADLFPGQALPAKAQLVVNSDQLLTGFALTFNISNTQIVAVPAVGLEE